MRKWLLVLFVSLSEAASYSPAAEATAGQAVHKETAGFNFPSNAHQYENGSGTETSLLIGETSSDSSEEQVIPLDDPLPSSSIGDMAGSSARSELRFYEVESSSGAEPGPYSPERPCWQCQRCLKCTLHTFKYGVMHERLMCSVFVGSIICYIFFTYLLIAFSI